MGYTSSDKEGLEKFRRIAKDKVGIDPNRILLGDKVKSGYIHLYLDDTTPGGSGALGCWKPERYEPTKITYKGVTYTQKNYVYHNNPILDDLIAAKIKEKLRGV